jgi:uncharacterized protein (DUF3820 family)
MINTHGVTMQNGRWAGQLITRVPVSYLKWMVQCGLDGRTVESVIRSAFKSKRYSGW